MVSRHLRDRHHVQVDIRRPIQLHLEQWQWPYDPQSVPLPLDMLLPQPELPVLDGFRCQSCGFKSTNRRVIRQHCNTKHNQKGLKDARLFQAVQLQTWFTEKWARYWAVDATRRSRDVNNGRGGGGGSGSGSDTAIKALIAARVRRRAEQQARLDDEILTSEKDPWLANTHWEEVLAGSKHDLVRTAKFTAPATADEPELERLTQSWERVLQRALATLAAVGKYKDIIK